MGKILYSIFKRQNTKCYINLDFVLVYIYICIENDWKEMYKTELSISGFNGQSLFYSLYSPCLPVFHIQYSLFYNQKNTCFEIKWKKKGT